MDPARDISRIKEQVKREHQARRNYATKWNKLRDPQTNKFYHPDEANRQLKQKLQLQELCPYTYTGEGDSYFVSKGMYDSLVAVCRCGRKRTEAHILKCLQNEQDKYLKFVAAKDEKDDYKEVGKKDKNKPASDVARNAQRRVPETSNTLIGWKKKNYKIWEDSMKYYSPVLTMTGPKVTATPYSVIYIG